jgi:hypothetical protein
LSLQEQHRLLQWVERANLPKALHFWKAELERNRHFGCLCGREKKKWLEGAGLYKKDGTYRGTARNAGFAGRSSKNRATCAGISGEVFDKLQRQFSAHVHMTPHAIPQIRAFHPIDSIGRQSLVEFPVMASAAILALGTNGFLRVFPGCDALLSQELRLLLAVLPQVLEEARRTALEERPQAPVASNEDLIAESDTGECPASQ